MFYLLWKSQAEREVRVRDAINEAEKRGKDRLTQVWCFKEVGMVL